MLTVNRHTHGQSQSPDPRGLHHSAIGLFHLRIACLAILLLCAVAGVANAQQLRFRLGKTESGPPDFATFRVGPLYSHLWLSQEVGVRYTEGTLGVVDYLAGTQRGAYRDNGIDFPLITSVTLRNYMLISRYMDVDVTLWARYEHYPLKTQDDMFIMNLADPELMADFSTSFLWELFPASYLKIKVFERPAYLLDYVDQRGTSDPYGGVRYHRFENDAGLDADILLRSDMDVALSFSRHDVVGVSEAFANQEQTGYSGSAAYEYQLTPIFLTGLRAGYQDVDYVSTTRGDFVSQNLMVFADAELSEQSKVSAAVGYGTGASSATNGTSGRIETDNVLGAFSFQTEIMRDTSFLASYTRAIRSGFNYGVETVDTLMGRIGWTDGALAVNLSSELAGVDVAGDYGIGYDDWRSAIDISYPLAADCTVGFTSSYLVRDVSPLPGMETAGLPSEIVHDYTTWVNRLRGTLAVMKNLTLGAYVEYVLRDSTAEGLKYDRFNAGLNLVFAYEY